MAVQSARVCIIGGGAAGFYSAIACAEAASAAALVAVRSSTLPAVQPQASAPGAGVLILEQSSDVLHKVRISGGGRCNVTYGNWGTPALAPARVYPRGAELIAALTPKHGPKETTRWFEAQGIRLKQEEDGRIFPVSNKSACVVNCLKEAAKRLGVCVRTSTRVQSIAVVGSSDAESPVSSTPQFQVAVADDSGCVSEFVCSRLVFCCGSAQKRSIRRLFTNLGIPACPVAPSLFSLLFEDPNSTDLQGLQGLAVPRACISVARFNGESPSIDLTPQTGAVLITHVGLSGPAILRLSAWGAFAFQSCAYHAHLVIDWLPHVADEHSMAEAIRAVPAGRPGIRPPVRKKPLGDVSPWPGHLPARLWRRLLERAERKHGAVLTDMTWGRLDSHEEALKLSRAIWTELKVFEVVVKGRRANKEEFVTAGGVDWRHELDWDRMESTSCPGVHFAGEVLDVDGITGGFNFQGCWTTGYVAGKAAAEALISTNEHERL